MEIYAAGEKKPLHVGYGKKKQKIIQKSEGFFQGIGSDCLSFIHYNKRRKHL